VELRCYGVLCARRCGTARAVFSAMPVHRFKCSASLQHCSVNGFMGCLLVSAKASDGNSIFFTLT
jgi:hypothetical protein